MKTQIGQRIDSVTPLTATPRGKLHRAVSWAGTCTSAVCAVHCFGMAIIALLSPGLLEILPHSEFAEAIVLAISVGTAAISLSRYHTKPHLWMLYSLFTSIGIAGLALHIHICLAIALSTLAILQLSVLWKRHHPKKSSNIPKCCQHEH